MWRVEFLFSLNSVVKRGRSRRYRGAERPKTRSRVTTPPSHAFVESGFRAAKRWSGADPKWVKAANIHLKPVTISSSIFGLSITPPLLCKVCIADWYLVIARMDLKTHWFCNSFNRWNYNCCWFTWNKTSLSFYIILFKQQKNIIRGNAMQQTALKKQNVNQVSRKLNSIIYNELCSCYINKAQS